MQLISGPSPTILRFRAKSCHEEGGPIPDMPDSTVSLGERLFLLSKDNNGRVRHQVATVLPKLEDDDFKVMVIQSMAHDMEAPVRKGETISQIALAVIPTIQQDVFKIPLIEGLAESPSVPYPGLLALGAASVQDTGKRDALLKKLMTHQRLSIREGSAPFVEKLQPGDTRDALIQGLAKDDSAICRVIAVKSLALISTPQLKETLEQGLKTDRTPEVLQALAEVSKNNQPTPARRRGLLGLLARIFRIG